MKRVLLCLVACVILAGCKKDDNSISESDLLINATVYWSTIKVPANIAFVSADRTDVIKDEVSVANYFATNPKHSKKGVDQYSEYLPKGDYIIVIQIPEGSLLAKGKVYTYKRVSTTNSPAFGNVMQFNGDITLTGYYQVWHEKE